MGEPTRYTRHLLSLLFVVALAWGLVSVNAAAAESHIAAVIELDGAIGPGTAGYVLRSLHEAQQQDVAVVVLRLDTPGGLDSAMRDIIRALLASPIPVLAYVAPSGARAASAGTYILYAAALAAMAPGTNLGAATPVSLFGQTPLPGSGNAPNADGGKSGQPAPNPTDALLAKVTNDSVAYIRSLAVLHGHNADWAEKAVREAASLSYNAALDQHVIDLIASDIPDLLSKAEGHPAIVQGRPVRLTTQGLEIVYLKPGWRERLLGFLTDPSIVYLLLLAGVAGVAFELSHPGVYAPGVIGTICLLLGGYGLNLLPVSYAGLALGLLGLGLMVAEAFVPSFGAFVLGGAASFAIGSLMMFDTPGVRPPPALIVVATLASATLFGIVLTLLLRARRRPAVTGTA
ncbi:MAG: nodulation protein NfeD, partial [Acetobacteraceae bacterium]|nr:nodulation protein NfeD [Acetobacteraceae bacterium]MBV8574831.1 nodulation protein NfeD [Acetobacteraceae bacterium]